MYDNSNRKEQTMNLEKQIKETLLTTLQAMALCKACNDCEACAHKDMCQRDNLEMNLLLSGVQ